MRWVTSQELWQNHSAKRRRAARALIKRGLRIVPAEPAPDGQPGVDECLKSEAGGWSEGGQITCNNMTCRAPDGVPTMKIVTGQSPA